MSDILKAIILGLVEGATEFIPVSSTGHLILAGDWLNFEGDRAKSFEVFIQLGAILAVVWLYRAKFLNVVRTAGSDPLSRRLLINLAIAFVPAALTGFLIHGWIKEHLFNPVTVAWALLVGGVAILIIEWWNPPEAIEDADHIPHSKALGIGLAQVLSLFPGISRSGATIMGARGLGLSRRAAAEFSFFLAIPVMFAATGFDLFKSRDTLSVGDAPVFAVGFVVSFLSAIVVVKAFLGFVSRYSFKSFAWYRIAFGALLLFMYWNRGA
ncbi:MAG TPA: undecaprenyl-diphosphate phosphatase [Longimicrobiales bacterium]